MYPAEDHAVPQEQPVAFITIEQCRKELSRIEGKLSPIMGGGLLEKSSGEAPSLNELDARLQQLLSHIRDIGRRIKL
jgi:hypothetical protein